MRSSVRFLFFSILILAGIVAKAQPVNDNCNTARLLVAGTNCVPVSVNADGATQSAPPEDCNTFTSDEANDVWFSFVATAGSMKIRVTPDSTYDAVIFLYSSCASAAIACADATVNGDIETLSATGLTVGSTYYIRVYHFQYQAPYPPKARFDICVFNTPPAPSNNECISAIQLAAGNTCIPVHADASEATESTIASSCGGFESPEAKDVWFKFTANSTKMLVRVSPSENYDAVVVLYDVCNGTELNCSDRGSNGEQENMFLDGLIPGTEYIVRVYHFALTAYPEMAEFDICVFTPPPPPANDECSGAISINTYADLNCTPTSANSEFATPSQEPISCSQTSFDDDLWYKFVASTDAVMVRASNFNGFSSGIGMTLYEGSCAGPQTPECEFRADGDSLAFYHLTPGTTYYLRIFTALAAQRGTFDFCVINRTTPQAPANDLCINAVELAVGSHGVCTPTRGTAYFATQDFDPVNCGNGAAMQANEVWYSFVATEPEAIVDVIGDSAFDAIVEVYESCSGPSLECADEQIFPGEREVLRLDGLSTGETYLVRVYQYTASSTTPGFEICVYTAVTGIADNVSNKGMKIYPNPASAKIKVELSVSTDEISLVDQLGREVMRKSVKGSTELEIGSLSPGMYAVRSLMNGSVQGTQKLQVIR